MFPRFKRKKIIWSCLVLAVGLALFFSSARLQKFQQVLFDFMAPVYRLWDRVEDRYFTREATNTSSLEAENAHLRQQLIALEEEKKTWEAWQGIRSNLIKDLPAGVAARVIANDPAALRRSIILDKGAQDGLHPGQVVLAQGGLVGRLVQVSESTSQVLLLTDPISVVDVLAQSSRARGTIKGEAAEGRLGGEYFLIRDVLQVGDLLLTSGQDGIFPKGIPVGVVRNLQKEATGIFYRAQVEPVVQLKKLEIVEVL